MNSWAVSACYPRSTFYPLSDGPSIQNHRITMTCFRTCSSRHSRSQASLCHCTNLLMSDRLANLRAPPLLFGRRPPQSNYPPDTVRNPDYGSTLEHQPLKGGISGRLHADWRPRFKASHLSYTSRTSVQCQAIVKVHGVFPSCRGYTASSQRVQFH